MGQGGVEPAPLQPAANVASTASCTRAQGTANWDDGGRPSPAAQRHAVHAVGRIPDGVLLLDVRSRWQCSGSGGCGRGVRPRRYTHASQAVHAAHAMQVVTW
jgi:hypothetical protein